MKVTKQETLYRKDHGATLKHKCGKKDSSIVPSLFFSHFLGLLFFYLTWDNALENDDHHISIYLQLNDYNSILEQSMTLYECLRRCTGMGNESRVTCMKNYAWWLCHKYDVNYMIMQWQYDKINVCHDDDERNDGKLHGNISRNGYGNAINR